MLAFAIPGLEWLSKGFAYALHWLASIAGGNYGVAIILLTILMRIIILPLSIKQTKSMIAMQKLQPQLKEIQKKYKDDREKMGQEMMALYKENKVSPFGGCLPLILQLPIIFAVFEVLRSLANPKSPYFSILFPGVNNLRVATNPQLQFAGMNITYTGAKLWSKAGGQAYIQVIVLIILTVITGYVSAKMMTTDPKQAKMMAMMPLLMGVFAWILPAGVTIYIIVTNIITMIQQYVQLEHDGFYDEKLNELRNMGDKAKWYQTLYLKFMDIGTKTLIAVRLRPKPKPAAKKKTAKIKTGNLEEGEKPAQVAATGDKSSAPEEKSQTTRKKQAKAKPSAAAPQKKASGIKPASKAPSKNYPAKKKSSGKK
jgi:YidC/Oxa1 family membrane protein insertase